MNVAWGEYLCNKMNVFQVFQEDIEQQRLWLYFPVDAAALVVFPLLLGSSGQRKDLLQEACIAPKLVSVS